MSLKPPVEPNEPDAGVTFHADALHTFTITFGQTPDVLETNLAEIHRSSLGGVETCTVFRVLAEDDASAAYTCRATGDTEDRLFIFSDGYIAWGSGAASQDTVLYRSAANKLKTDDMFLATLGLGVGNSVSASESIGKAVTRKIQVFDASGSSLGYVPVYASIT